MLGSELFSCSGISSIFWHAPCKMPRAQPKIYTLPANRIAFLVKLDVRS